MDVTAEMLSELQRYYALWKESTATYEEWAKEQGLSANGLLVLYFFYAGEEPFTQKAIGKKWNIPKQTVSAILKEFEQRGYVKLTCLPADKRNKQIRLTPAGKRLTDAVMAKLQQKGLYVMQQMGLETVTSMNDQHARFLRCFREGDSAEHD